MMIDDLKAFIAVFDDASLTRAAAKLHLTQSAISRRLQQLEARLGGTLFDRASKPLAPTALAHQIQWRARELLRNADDLLALASAQGEPSGSLRLGITHALSEAVLLPILSRMKTVFPALAIQLQCDWTPALLQGVQQGQTDIALVLLPAGGTPGAPMLGRCVGSLKVVVVQSRAAPRVGGPTAIAALAGEDWILNAKGCGYRAALAHAMHTSGAALRVYVDSQGVAEQLRLVASGLGLGLVPQALLDGSPSAGELAIVETPDFSLSVDICLVHRTGLGNLARVLEQLELALTLG